MKKILMLILTGMMVAGIAMAGDSDKDETPPEPHPCPDGYEDGLKP